MAQSSHKVIHPESTYDVIELIGTALRAGKTPPRR
jgi:hypothetical protein